MTTKTVLTCACLIPLLCFRVLYEDEHLLVVNKPPGLAVQPCESQPSGTLLHGVLHHLMYNSRWVSMIQD
jgi:23S rRNA-/tRNA-specific pseudouridylate synthase